MGWIDVETVRLLSPALADVLEGGEPIEGLEALGKVVGIDEGCEVRACPSSGFLGQQAA